jgi:hypothetical protein
MDNTPLRIDVDAEVHFEEQKANEFRNSLYNQAKQVLECIDDHVHSSNYIIEENSFLNYLTLLFFELLLKYEITNGIDSNLTFTELSFMLSNNYRHNLYKLLGDIDLNGVKNNFLKSLFQCLDDELRNRKRENTIKNYPNLRYNLNIDGGIYRSSKINIKEMLEYGKRCF